ncbi:hypothetical protein [Oharaeibacter diazotrophicus]|uniref:hypothetical protein n=1 Tax=Oharaeibacter diazotrophicus TaxID=1920512 RepID=UPI000F838138|nr:hypothetical protein [Oharaeibacter diazotrophicus]
MSLPTALAGGDTTADLVIRLRPLPDRLATPLASGTGWSLDHRDFLLELDGIARIRVRDGREIAVDPAPGTAADDAAAFAVGTGLGVTLLQRGVLPLHAAAVGHRGRAVLLCGVSGAGKSTLAGALCRAGCDFLADDVAALAASVDGPPVVQPDGRALRLHPESIAALDLAARAGSPVRPAVAKRHVAPPTAVPGPLPIGAVFVLAPATPARPAGITAMPVLAAAQALLRHTFRRGLALMIAPAVLTREIATLADSVPVATLVRPQRFADLDATAAAVLAHLDAAW